MALTKVPPPWTDEDEDDEDDDDDDDEEEEEEEGPPRSTPRRAATDAARAAERGADATVWGLCAWVHAAPRWWVRRKALRSRRCAVFGGYRSGRGKGGEECGGGAATG